MAGASYPEVHNGQQVLPVEGRSFLPLLAGKTRPGHERPIHGIALAPDGRRLVTASEDMTLLVWDTAAK